MEVGEAHMAVGIRDGNSTLIRRTTDETHLRRIHVGTRTISKLNARRVKAVRLIGKQHTHEYVALVRSVTGH